MAGLGCRIACDGAALADFVRRPGRTACDLSRGASVLDPPNRFRASRIWRARYHTDPYSLNSAAFGGSDEICKGRVPGCGHLGFVGHQSAGKTLRPSLTLDSFTVSRASRWPGKSRSSLSPRTPLAIGPSG